MTRTNAARLNRALCDIRASPQFAWCRYQAPHLFAVNTYYPSRDELHNKVIPRSCRRDQLGSTDSQFLLPVQPAMVSFHFLSLRVILVRRF
jgi:hypothetical protein